MTIRISIKLQRVDFTLDIDLKLPSRGVSSLFGPSGCGKTTVLRMIAGLERHEQAQLTVNGETWQDSVNFIPPHKRPIGYVFQEPSLFEHLDVRRNIEYGARRLKEGERRIPLEQAIDLLGVDALLHRRPATLSGGEKQRVSIARALAVSPQLLLMDEPLAAVDVTRKQEILPYIDSLHRELDIPVIHVSHLPEEVRRFADHLVLMESGRAVASGAVNDLFTRLDLPLSHDQGASSVIDAHLAGHERQDHLSRVEFPGGELLIPLCDRPPGSPVRLSIAARDVSLTLQRQSGTSILNIIETVVDGITPEGEARTIVRLLADKTPLLAGITARSARELDITPGKTVFAQVKSVALLD